MPMPVGAVVEVGVCDITGQNDHHKVIWVNKGSVLWYVYHSNIYVMCL